MISPEEVKTLEKALDAAKSYADVVVKGPLSELGSIFADTGGYWRLKNKVTLMLKAKKWLENKGVEPKQLLPSVFVPLLEDGSYVEDETLTDIFSPLLAKHLDPTEQSNVHPYVHESSSSAFANRC